MHVPFFGVLHPYPNVCFTKKARLHLFKKKNKLQHVKRYLTQPENISFGHLTKYSLVEYNNLRITMNLSSNKSGHGPVYLDAQADLSKWLKVLFHDTRVAQ